MSWTTEGLGNKFIKCKEAFESKNLKVNLEKNKEMVRKAHSTEHPSRGCPHLVLILQLIRLKQCI